MPESNPANPRIRGINFDESSGELVRRDGERRLAVAVQGDGRELAVVLARGYLRLLEKRRNRAVSRADSEQIGLEVPPVESPDVGPGRAS